MGVTGGISVEALQWLYRTGVLDVCFLLKLCSMHCTRRHDIAPLESIRCARSLWMPSVGISLVVMLFVCVRLLLMYVFLLSCCMCLSLSFAAVYQCDADVMLV